MCSSGRYSISKIELILLLMCAISTNSLNLLNVNGEVTFALKIPKGMSSFMERAASDTRVREESEKERLVLRLVRRNVTSARASLEDCQYRYPEEEQVQAILSNMMNELTKVFVKSQQLTASKDDHTSSGPSRRRETRFKVVGKKHTEFFEGIYKNMTNEFLNLHKPTAQHKSRSEVPRDPCAEQPLVRQMWRDLLDNSLAVLRAHARATIQKHKELAHRSEPSSSRLDQFLAREISKVRATQLNILCYKFQLCFNDLF